MPTSKQSQQRSVSSLGKNSPFYLQYTLYKIISRQHYDIKPEVELKSAMKLYPNDDSLLRNPNCFATECKSCCSSNNFRVISFSYAHSVTLAEACEENKNYYH